MAGLPGGVSGPPHRALAPLSIPTETASSLWWASDRPQNTLLKAVPGHTWSGWDAGSFLARAVHHGPQPIFPLCLLPLSFSPPFLPGASELLCKALQAEMGGSFELRHLQNLLSLEMLVWSQGCHITWDVHATLETCSLEPESTSAPGKSDPVVDLLKPPWEAASPAMTPKLSFQLLW